MRELPDRVVNRNPLPSVHQLSFVHQKQRDTGTNIHCVCVEYSIVWNIKMELSSLLHLRSLSCGLCLLSYISLQEITVCVGRESDKFEGQDNPRDNISKASL